MKIIKATCPSCSTSNLFPFEEIGSCTVCSGCRSVYNPSEPEVLRKNLLKETKDLFLLALETKLNWEGEIYSITGYVVKQEKEDPVAIWVEYFLTNPSLPNLYLSYFNGHWTLIEYLPEINRAKGSVRNIYNMTYQKVEYDFHHKYDVKILDAQGCFNFPFYEDDGNHVREYVNYDEVLIWEENREENNIRFYRGKYMFSVSLNRLLEPAVKLPKRIGYVAHQPFYFPVDGRSFRLMSLLLIGCMALGMMCWRAFFDSEQIHQGRLIVSSADPSTITSQPFEINYDHSLLNIKASVYNMNNDWVYSEMALINTKTGEERFFEMETEFYSGVEGGESWSEGDREINGNIQYLNKGTYVLEVTPRQQEYSVDKTILFELVSQKGSWSIFWVMTALIVIINIILGILGDYFRNKKFG